MDYSFDILTSRISYLGLYNWFYYIYFNCYLLTCSCIHVLMIQFLIHTYDLNLLIDVCLPMCTTWLLPHHLLGSSDSPESSCSDLGARSLWIFSVSNQSAQRKRGSSADRLEPHPSRPLSRLPTFSFITRERLLYHSLLYTFLYSCICSISVM